MNEDSGSGAQKKRTSVALVLAAIFVAALIYIGSSRNQVTYPEAATEVHRLVDGSIRAGMGDLPLPPSEGMYPALCTNSTRVTKHYPRLVYHFPLDLLGPEPDLFVERIEEYWQSEGVRLDPDKNVPGLNGSFGFKRPEMHLEVFVNYKTGMALLSGNGQCTRLPEPDS